MWQYNDYSELYHHGILGQKWGIRRYQNPDGTLTPAGRERYGTYGRKHVSLSKYARDKMSVADSTYQSTEAWQKAIEKERAFWDLEKTAPYSKKQGKLWDQRNKLFNQARNETIDRLSEYLVSKYGEKRVKKYEKKLAKMKRYMNYSLDSFVFND